MLTTSPEFTNSKRNRRQQKNNKSYFEIKSKKRSKTQDKITPLLTRFINPRNFLKVGLDYITLQWKRESGVKWGR